MHKKPIYYPIKGDMPESEVLQHYRELAEKREKEAYHPLAAFSSGHQRFFGSEQDHRLPYKRDVDRIIHSKAYTRYIDKTQVVYLVDNDHVTHRALHVQLVSSFARGIAEILRLNLDLVEAISLGHDVGHPPFGHEGEEYLSALSHEYGNNYFAHPWQSCRLLFEIEPLNLGLAVYDGFLCHDGGMRHRKLEPALNKTWDDHFAELKVKFQDPNADFNPGTMEGCLVKFCDTMSYLGRDIEDAINLGIITRDQVPETILGRTNREILSFLASDMIKMSFDKPYIEISEDVYKALKTLRAFNFEFIYNHPKLKKESLKIEKSYRILFETLLQDLRQNGAQSYMGMEYLENKPKQYLENTDPVQKVVDYIAGMTDSFFVRMLDRLVVPTRIEL